MLKKLLAVLLLGAVLGLSPACITDPVTGEKTIGMPMSDSAEIAEGNKFAPSFKSQYEGAYPDRDLQEYLGGIVLGIARDSHRPDLPWNFTLLNSSEVNAFALPGGTVCITRGLLHQLDSEAEFAAVMGHEVGHVAHRHSVQSMGQSALVGLVITGLAVGAEAYDSDLANLGAQLGAVGGQLLLLRFSRDDEREADQRGVEYSHHAGYDPREMAGVFELFKELKGGGGQPALLSSHPLDDQRIAAVDREVREKYPQVQSTDGAGLRKSTPTWNRLLGRLRSEQEVYEVYDEANEEFVKAAESGDPRALTAVLRKLESCEARLPRHALFVSGQGVVLFELGRKRQAGGKFERAASLQPDLFEPRVYLAQIAYDAGDPRTALRHAEQAERLFPQHPLPHYLSGRCHDDLGDLRQASTGYRSVLQLAPEESEVYRFSDRRLREIQTAEERAGARRVR